MEKAKAHFEIKLIVPISWGSETIDRLVIRRPKLKDMKKAGKIPDEFDQMVSLLSELTGHAPPVIEELDVEDLAEATKILTDFTGKFQKTGDSGSET